MHSWLISILTLLFAAVIATVLCRSLKLPAMLGYLLVGLLVGPFSLGLIPASVKTDALAEFGVVFLMFTIGLEFSLPKLKSMRSVVFGLGGLQVLLTSALLVGALLLLNVDWRIGIALGGALAMSSTAIVSKLLTERAEFHAPHAQHSIGILLFQDLAVVPLLVLIPALAQTEGSIATALGIAAVKATLMLSVLLVFGQPLLRPWFHLVARQRSSELFMFNVLFVTLGIAFLTELAGLSLALGAFLAGMLISETEYRYQVEDDIKPFRDILLGLFFITIGMKMNFATVVDHFGAVLIVLLILAPGKAVIIMVVSRLMGNSPSIATRTALTLAQAGEFGFVILTLTKTELHLPTEVEQILLAAMMLSMLLAPIIIQYSDRVVSRFIGSEWMTQATNLHQIAMKTFGIREHVILCGYGRSGQGLARFLEQENLSYFAVDMDPERVQKATAAGESVVYGDASKREVLMSAGLMRAKAIVITYADTPSALKILNHIQSLRPDLPVIVRTQDDTDIEKLRNAGATEVVADVMEGSLMLASHALMLLGTPLNRVLKRIRDAREERYQFFRGFFRGASDDLDIENENQPRLYTVQLTYKAFAIGMTLAELDIDSYLAEIKAVKRPKSPKLALNDDLILQSGDIIVLLGTPENLASAEIRLLQG